MTSTSTITTRGAGVAPAPRRRRRLRGPWVAALMFLAPTLVLLVILRVIPTFQAIVSSFQKSSSLLTPPTFAGFNNYIALFSNGDFMQVLGVTGLFIVIIVPGQVVIAIFLALLLNERFRGRGIIRSFIFLPVAAPAAVATVIWGIAFQPRGPINAVLEAVGIPGQPFLTSPDQALLAIVVLMSWIGVGYWTVFLLAGLQDIPLELYEAASLDGSGWWRAFISITLPNLRRTLAFVVVANTVANLIAFVPVAVLTSGGPAGSTRLIMFDTYNNTFVLGDVHLGSAEVTILIVILVAVTAVQFRLLGREEK